MDLSFSRPIPVADAALPPADIAALVAPLTARLGASATALAQDAIEHPLPDRVEPLLAPLGGAFNAAMAARLTEWKHA